MPSMMAFYSIGNIVGPIAVAIPLYFDQTPFSAALFAVAIIIATLLFYMPHFITELEHAEVHSSRKSLPQGVVLLLGLMCFSVFLVEGAIMDWGALFLAEYKSFDFAHAGIGFSVFSAALAMARLGGVWIIRHVGSEKRVVLLGCGLSFIGFLLVLFVLPQQYSLLGFFIIGLGNANVIPLLFAETGKQKIMPTTAAISTVTTLGYSGILVGPALIGFLAEATSLFISFFLLGILMLVVAGFAARVIQRA